MSFDRIAGLALCAFFVTGCISHPIVKDYPGYLESHQGVVSLAPLAQKAGYLLTDRTRNHQLQFRWAAAGAAHIWIVDFGQMLDLTLKSPDYATSFAPAGNDDRLTVRFDLVEYRFKNFQAYVEMKIDVVKNGKAVLSKQYSTTGRNQTSKVMWGGAFAAKSAITVSTKLAIDQIMSELRADLQLEKIALGHFGSSNIY